MFPFLVVRCDLGIPGTFISNSNLILLCTRLCSSNHYLSTAKICSIQLHWLTWRSTLISYLLILWQPKLWIVQIFPKYQTSFPTEMHEFICICNSYSFISSLMSYLWEKAQGFFGKEHDMSLSWRWSNLAYHLILQVLVTFCEHYTTH